MTHLKDAHGLTVLGMIDEWEKGCTVSRPGPPEDCIDCTVGLIDAIRGRATQDLLGKGMAHIGANLWTVVEEWLEAKYDREALIDQGLQRDALQTS